MDQQYMQRALDLALKGQGYTNPNPLVGAVIVREGRIIGEGYHACYGQAHAEVNALENATEDVVGATLYVTLEPCAHHGKTPPCANRLVEAGIKKVVVGMVDPNPLVAGKGIEILKNHGIETITGVLEAPIKKINEIFIHHITQKTPFTILKYAMTLDGKIATVAGHSQWISNEASRAYVHTIRHRVAGIMVGIDTLLADDPCLSTRLPSGEGQHPIPIVVDSLARTPIHAEVFSMIRTRPVIVAITQEAPVERIERLEAAGARVLQIATKQGHVDLKALMVALGQQGMDSVLLEGGSTLAYGALEACVVQRVMAFIAPKIIGGARAKTPVGGDGIRTMDQAIMLNNISYKQFIDDLMIEGDVEVLPCLQA